MRASIRTGLFPPQFLISYKGERSRSKRIEVIDVSNFIGRLLCRLGLHNVRVIDVTLGFGVGGGVEKVECRRCGIVMSRKA